MVFLQVKDLAAATASMVKQRLQQMRTELMRLITDWEKSRQGALPMERTLDNKHMQRKFDCLDKQSLGALNDRAAFLCKNKCSCLLILWEEADEHQLLALMLQRLDRSVGAPDALNTISVWCLADKHSQPKPVGNKRRRVA
jgi:hypothetical protein